MDINKNNDLLIKIEEAFISWDENNLKEILKKIHYADLAEISTNFDIDEILLILKNISNTKWADYISELEEDIRDRVVKALEPQEVANILEELESDDAADILTQINDEEKWEIFSLIEDKRHLWEIAELASYKEWTAWALMAKELVKVKENWTIDECLKEVRVQAQLVDRIHSVYLVNEKNELVWRVSLKDLISASASKKVSEIRKKRVDSVSVSTPINEVSYIMEKYNMEAIPVIDTNNKLLWRITIDDVIDFIRDKAEENYNLASGLTQEVDELWTLWDTTKARLPWLFLALIWWFFAVSILWWFEEAMESNWQLFFFTPLIAAMAWNVWVQSSAIVVQALANNSLKWWLLNKFFKELLLSILNWILLASILYWIWYFIFWFESLILIAVSISLIAVIILASMIWTFIPILLNRIWINPAMATWPFITTSNDIFWILIYFTIAKLIIWF